MVAARLAVARIAAVGGLGGQMKFAGVHTTGGKTDGRIGKITMGGTGGNGGVGGFTEEEKVMLRGALCDVSNRLRAAADRI